MTQEHPITPPTELLDQWAVEYWGSPGEFIAPSERHIATQAARWGADQELEACCMEIIDGAGLFYIDETSDRVCLTEDIRAARRPKPPSLKEQAMEDLDSLIADLANHGMGFKATNIRRALEQLPDHE